MYLLVAEGLSILVSRAMELGVYEAAELGRNRVAVSHLLYADDTIFIGKESSSNIIAIRRILKNFELLSGLKVNFQKCNLMGVNTDGESLALGKVP